MELVTTSPFLYRETYTLPEYALIMGIHENTARRHAKEGLIPGIIMVGKRYHVPREALKKQLNGEATEEA